MAWLAVVLPATIAVLIALAGVIWRLGGLQQNVKEVDRRMGRVERLLDALSRRRRRDRDRE